MVNGLAKIDDFGVPTDVVVVVVDTEPSVTLLFVLVVDGNGVDIDDIGEPGDGIDEY